MRASKLPILAGALAGLALGSTALAQQLDAAARADAVAKLSTALRDRYVFPEVGTKAAEVIEGNLKSGAYDQLADPGAFAQRLTADLGAVAHDKHLKVSSRGAPPPPPATGAPKGPWPPRNELGVVRADKLPGDIGYIEVALFPPPERFKPVIDKAMTALAGSKALIFDLRRNGGGSPASVAYLVSFMTPADKPTHINDIVSRKAGTLEFDRKVYNSEVTPVRFAGVPAFVLTSAQTFSGGEEFSYDLQALKLATLVGEVTGGGANPTGGVPLSGDLGASVPNGRAENPVTRTNWEGVGVKPDVAVPADDALATALKRLSRPAVAQIADAGGTQVFAPRSTPVAGSRQILERALNAVQTGDPDTSYMSARAVVAMPRQVAFFKGLIGDAGAVRDMVFREPDAMGGDVYDVTFERKTLRCAVVLNSEGKLDGLAVLGPPRAP